MIDQEHLLDDLTDAQRQAVTHIDGPLLIIAGAGSGKTRVITRRVAFLIAQGIQPGSILGITFTNKAAGEMKERVAAACGRSVRDFGRLDQNGPMICTFHSLCMRVLRHYGDRIDLPPGFSIYDSSDQTRLLKEAIKSLDISSDVYPAAVVHSAISNAKNHLVTAQAFAQQAVDLYQQKVARIYTRYQQLLNQNNALDFDDLLLRVTLSFREHPDVLKELQDRFAYLMIDEYQDTNHVQYILAHALAMKHRNICVVGDPDQSIYKWRGADIKNILEFEKDYPDAKIVRLEQNYRSTKTILHVASDLIANNSQRKEKALWTENQQGDRVKLLLCRDEHDEAEAVAAELRKLHDQGVEWNQMAIFYRMNSLSRLMERSLFNARMPYQIARGVEFYGRKEIKDVLAYLRVIANPADEVNLERIVNVPTRGVGDGALSQLQAWAISQNMPLLAAMEKVGEIGGLSSRAANGVRSFVKLVTDLRNMPANGVRDIMEAVVKRSGMEDMLKKLGGDEQEEMANVNELITSAAEFDEQNPEGTLQDYLAQVSLVSDVDQLKDGGGAITLMTLHAAKGLEFPVVAMLGLEEGCLPHARARENPDDMEEERRLCFVGITRAQERLILSSAAWRMVRGQSGPTMRSPFLKEMPQQLLEVVDRTGQRQFDRGRDVQYLHDDDSQADESPFHQGQMVRHPMFGVGKIAEIAGTGEQMRAVVDFKNGARKTLMLVYAKLKPVG
ncbi:MAG TPA: UvrD-helicase domain-containing protein [Tepidisphaeraceae bacterium]|nr:UvrD-helicase domain-containing protein [Tepidisphaeraceae bacterium]